MSVHDVNNNNTVECCGKSESADKVPDPSVSQEELHLRGSCAYPAFHICMHTDAARKRTACSASNPIRLFSGVGMQLSGLSVVSGALLILQIPFAGVARDFSPRVNFQCRRSYGFRTKLSTFEIQSILRSYTKVLRMRVLTEVLSTSIL